MLGVALSMYWAYDARETADHAESIARESGDNLSARLHDLGNTVDHLRQILDR